tara:strand:+ start:524 stop:751 length:228 start_codon:yes stop_codon:yes gene_type:complete
MIKLKNILNEGLIPSLVLDEIHLELKKIDPKNNASITIFKWPNYIKLIAYVKTEIDEKYHKKFDAMMKKNGWVGM